MPVCCCRSSMSSLMLPLGSPTSMTTWAPDCSSVSRFSSPLPPYSWPIWGMLKYFSSKKACASLLQALDTPTSLSGHRANSTIWARGPLMATLSIWVGTSTWRPVESVKTRVVGSGVGSCLVPQAARPSTMTAASSRAISLFAFMFFSFFLFIPNPHLRISDNLPTGCGADTRGILPARWAPAFPGGKRR